MGDYAKAEPLYKEALEIRQKVLGREHPDTATSLNNLAELYRGMGDYAKAEPLLKEALEIYQKVLGPEHPFTATGLNNLAVLYQDMGDYAKAEPLFKEALEIHQKVLGPDHPDTATSLNNLALLELDLGKIRGSQTTQPTWVRCRTSKRFPKSFRSAQRTSDSPTSVSNIPTHSSPRSTRRDPLLASAVLHYKGVVLDSIIEDRLLAETSKEEANRELVEQLKTKKRMVAQLSLQTTAVSPKEANERIEALEQEVENIEGKLARQVTDLGQARRALAVTVEQVQAAIPNDAVLVEYVRYQPLPGKIQSSNRATVRSCSRQVLASLGHARQRQGN